MTQQQGLPRYDPWNLLLAAFFAGVATMTFMTAGTYWVIVRSNAGH